MGDFKGGGFNDANVDVLKGHFGWLFQVIWLERQFDRVASIISVVTICIKLVSTYKYITINCIDEEQINSQQLKTKKRKTWIFLPKQVWQNPDLMHWFASPINKSHLSLCHFTVDGVNSLHTFIVINLI